MFECANTSELLHTNMSNTLGATSLGCGQSWIKKKRKITTVPQIMSQLRCQE